MRTQLLCTFCKNDELDETCKKILDKYEVVFEKIFVLENVEDTDQLIMTYNVVNADLNDILESTISVHRKKQSNTIYTINALNKLIMEKNNGILDKKFLIDWSELENTILVTAYGKLKRISTQISEIIHL
jgi:hypothetical protein